MTNRKKILTIILLPLLLTVTATAQQNADSTYTYTFRFVHENDMFFVPWNGNGTELQQQTKESEGQHIAESGELAPSNFKEDVVQSADKNKNEAEMLMAEQAEENKNEPESYATRRHFENDSLTTPTHSFSLRANLLRWATLTPDIGIEWRVNRSWGILVNGSWTSWTWSNNDRRYALWEVMPEIRYYIGEKKAWYAGAMFKVGQFNYKFSDTGRQGDLIGGGISGGYQLRLNKALALDFNLGLGYLNADYEKYEVIDGVRVRQGSETKNWWGPINAGITLMWTMF